MLHGVQPWIEVSLFAPCIYSQLEVREIQRARPSFPRSLKYQHVLFPACRHLLQTEPWSEGLHLQGCSKIAPNMQAVPAIISSRLSPDCEMMSNGIFLGETRSLQDGAQLVDVWSTGYRELFSRLTGNMMMNRRDRSLGVAVREERNNNQKTIFKRIHGMEDNQPKAPGGFLPTESILGGGGFCGFFGFFGFFCARIESLLLWLFGWLASQTSKRKDVNDYG
jgi:hypothetical protein